MPLWKDWGKSPTNKAFASCSHACCRTKLQKSYCSYAVQGGREIQTEIAKNASSNSNKGSESYLLQPVPWFSGAAAPVYAYAHRLLKTAAVGNE